MSTPTKLPFVPSNTIGLTSHGEGERTVQPKAKTIMEYHAIHHNYNVVIRPKINGLTDYEFQHGCRILNLDAVSQYKVHREVETSDMAYKILKDEQWSEYMASLDDSPLDQPDIYRKFYSRYQRIDKWDSLPNIY